MIQISSGLPSTSTVLTRQLSQVTTSRNLSLQDRGRHLFNASAGSFTLTIPSNVFSEGDELEIACPGAGSIVVTPGSGVTLNGGSGSLTCRAGKGAYLKFYSAGNVWIYGG
jgi:hypothetical protein